MSGPFESRLRYAERDPVPSVSPDSIDVVLAAVDHPAGKLAVQQIGGDELLRELQRGHASHVAILIGCGPRVVLPCLCESELHDIARELYNLLSVAPGPMCFLPFGGPDLRERLVESMKAHELTCASPGGHA
jgi:hypothetical protein